MLKKTEWVEEYQSTGGLSEQRIFYVTQFYQSKWKNQLFLDV